MLSTRRDFLQTTGCGFGYLAWQAMAQSQAAIEQAVIALRAGKIVAIKGLGGFHLACDATQQAAVMRLRQRKHRPTKPLAVMLPDIVWLAPGDNQGISSIVRQRFAGQGA